MNQLLSLFLLLFSFQAFAADRGLEIARSISESNKGFGSEQSDMTMVLINGDKKIERKMTSKTLETGKESSKSLLEFLLPKDVAGTKLLTWSSESEEDSQWIYLPAFKKIKRISSSSKSSSFMGSEFTYEDLRASILDKFTYKFIKEEQKDGDTLWIFEKYSKESSAYTKQIVTASKKYMNAIKVDFYDRSNSLLKVGEFSDFKKFTAKGKDFWRANKVSMKNKQTLKESELLISERELGKKMSENDFRKNSLK